MSSCISTWLSRSIMEDESETSFESQCDLDGFLAQKIPHINEFKCDYCGTLWMTHVDHFPVGEKIETICGQRLCMLCAEEEKNRLFSASSSKNVWNKKVWLDCFVKFEDFYCCNCGGRNPIYNIRTHPTELILIHTYIHFEPHRLCNSCFVNVFNDREDILHPAYCDLCKKGPYETAPLRNEVRS